MKIVIVGGGFGGVKTALNLAGLPGFEVTLISDKENFEYRAALYRSATGRSPLEVVMPLKKIFARAPRVEVQQGKITSIDLGSKTVIGQDHRKYSYDRLICAVGNVTDYYQIKGLKEFSYGIKSITEALELKNHLHQQLTTGQIPELNYVVVGAGATGVELAGELVIYLRRLRERHGYRKHFKVIVVESAPRILPLLPEDYSRRVAQRLQQLGVKIYTSTAVKAETAHKLQLPEGNIETHTVIWTAGVTINPLFEDHPNVFQLDGKGKVKVDSKLLAAKDIYVIGDSAATVYSGMAQTALYDANFVSNRIGGKQVTYRPPQPISAIPVGRRWCAVLAGNRRLYGYPGWLLRRLADLKLYLTFLPWGLAISTWLSGNKIAETCPVCSGRAATE